MKQNKGFTLIELLVVIAIIGILSAVVLASLNTARDRGADAAKQSNLNNIRAQAELYYGGDGGGSYSGVCDDDDIVARAVDSSDGSCYDESETGITSGWAANAKLSTDKYYCTDYTGNATTTESDTISVTDANCK